MNETMVPLGEALDRIFPGSRPITVRPLHGGMRNMVHAVDLLRPSGQVLRLVVRRSPGGRGQDVLYHKAWHVLSLLKGSSVPVPAPLFHDPTGAIFGVPAIVISWLPGNPVIVPDDAGTWISRMAGALAALHDSALESADARLLPALDESIIAWLGGPPNARRLAHPLGPPLWSALQRLRSRVDIQSKALLHGDYGPVNILWSKGKLSGVVDWDSAGIGVPEYDVAHCRIDVALLCGLEAADRLLEAYEEARGRISGSLFWDLARCWVALPDPERWLPAVHSLGHTELTTEIVHARLEAFIAARLSCVR